MRRARRAFQIVDQTNNSVEFRIKKTTKMQKVLDAYHEQRGAAPSTLRITLDGERVNGKLTAEELDIDDGTTLDAFVEAVGGRC
mmetsp:Transcript_52552/g.155119  ORF Transcript_52552/g.155119 Transcript_52552/m.155119 type:complete len:84 (+) Transcript_52552:493-744(+)